MFNFLNLEIPGSLLLATIEFLIEKRFYRMKQIPIQDVYTFERVNYITYLPDLKNSDIQKLKKASLFLKEKMHQLDERISNQIYGIYCHPSKTSFWQQDQPEGFINLDYKDSKKDRMALILHTNTIQKLSDQELNASIAVELAKLDLEHPLETIYRQQQFFEFSKQILIACIGLLIHEAVQYDFYQKESPEFLLIISIMLLVNTIHQHYKKILHHYQYQADEKSIRFSNDADSLVSALHKRKQGTWFSLFEHSSYDQREHHIAGFDLKLA